jgi:hypothetical protein
VLLRFPDPLALALPGSVLDSGFLAQFLACPIPEPARQTRAETPSPWVKTHPTIRSAGQNRKSNGKSAVIAFRRHSHALRPRIFRTQSSSDPSISAIEAVSQMAL